ncbi:hypothetical protein [Campylobacter sp. RM16187]|uniref:hypothetical protein n=1 Tax=Campylobacter sp. RM16187 TaxID=1660063 RepID=UPI0021B66C41|nr:hypothetical protein [Campylobacter sp. RM16187]QKG28619.1 hypothetical protein CDOMF_0331 [Campylobacter sp. RM16187]
MEVKRPNSYWNSQIESQEGSVERMMKDELMRKKAYKKNQKNFVKAFEDRMDFYITSSIVVMSLVLVGFVLKYMV